MDTIFELNNMNFELPKPYEDRKDIYDKHIKPIVTAAVDNKAVDKWMYNLTEDNKVNHDSVVFVSTNHKRIFIIKGIYEYEQPPEFDKTLKKDSTQYERDLWRKHNQMHRMVYGLPQRIKTEKKDGTFTDELKTWWASLQNWNLDDRSGTSGFRTYVYGR